MNRWGHSQLFGYLFVRVMIGTNQFYVIYRACRHRDKFVSRLFPACYSTICSCVFRVQFPQFFTVSSQLFSDSAHGSSHAGSSPHAGKVQSKTGMLQSKTGVAHGSDFGLGFVLFPSCFSPVIRLLFDCFRMVHPVKVNRSDLQDLRSKTCHF